MAGRESSLHEFSRFRLALGSPESGSVDLQVVSRGLSESSVGGMVDVMGSAGTSAVILSAGGARGTSDFPTTSKI